MNLSILFFRQESWKGRSFLPGYQNSYISQETCLTLQVRLGVSAPRRSFNEQLNFLHVNDPSGNSNSLMRRDWFNGGVICFGSRRTERECMWTAILPSRNGARR